MRELKDLKGFWIRKNKNVQVRCLVNFNTDDERRILVCFRNGHQKYMSKEQLLSEFINLDELLAEITEGTRWVNIEHGYSIQVSNVRVRAAAVMYRIDGVAEEYSHGGVDIQRFKNMFKPETSGETA